MTDKNADAATRLLEGAYALQSADDNINYYRDFSAIYDEKFAAGMGYVYPQLLASIYLEHSTKTDAPVVDIGCGTGLLAQAIRLHHDEAALAIDGIDISPEMLAVARSKSVYRSCYQADLKQNMADLPRNYGAVLSAGTFTFGHLGADTLPDLLALGRPGALYCIGVNSALFDQQGFSKVLDQMVKNDQISSPVLQHGEIYTDESSDHANDTATVLIFRQR